MLGGNHAATGAAAWVLLSSQAQIPLTLLETAVAGAAPGIGQALPEVLTLGFGAFDDTPGGVATGALVCAGAALLPDADHRNASIARSLPPVTEALCRTVGRIAGGHRQGTHSLLGIVAVVVLAWLVGLWTIDAAGGAPIYVGAGLASVLLVSLAAKALKFIPDTMRKTPWLVGGACGLAVAFFSSADPRWFVTAVGLGAAVHLAGDLLTVGGINLLWPVRIRRPRALRHAPVISSMWRPNGHVAVPLLGATGSWREWALSVPVAAYALFGMCVSVSGTLTHYFG
ncbi:metal-dependent hydrolase [Zhihengliuella halotolerans]|uniref:LexA-binding, inner membrane-associated putative hydrolase n=1 Tax=Zhihengliuella halotolerans TaxID=370736 RepID=A0A4Q8ABM1_9MICC|nr:metal-dependent hydrolase [Zhihengliuella halotolerans]RZU61434.1 LexA-binding, inner membrane-associated putative hydrolase [Zhihengliuella halotolerans]